MGLVHLVVVGALAGLALSQDCPILGPAYPEINPGSSAVFGAAKAALEDEITRALAGGQLDKGTYFGVQVFSRNSDKTLYEKYYGPSVGPDTLYRIASISKVVSVYTTLSELGDRYWNEPVTKYIPELAKLKVQNPVDDIDWSEVTLGALASHMGGIARDCKTIPLRHSNDADGRRRAWRPLPLPPARSTGAADPECVPTGPVRHRRGQSLHESGCVAKISPLTRTDAWQSRLP